jgi:2,5-diketo-D-gluconate reductase A
MSFNSVSIPELPLVYGAPGTSIPLIGLGTYKITGQEEVERTLKTALQIGYRHIDTAALYDNEAFIGVLNDSSR